jgi:hypothetical protein
VDGLIALTRLLVLVRRMEMVSIRCQVVIAVVAAGDAEMASSVAVVGVVVVSAAMASLEDAVVEDSVVVVVTASSADVVVEERASSADVVDVAVAEAVRTLRVPPAHRRTMAMVDGRFSASGSPLVVLHTNATLYPPEV